MKWNRQWPTEEGIVAIYLSPDEAELVSDIVDDEAVRLYDVSRTWTPMFVEMVQKFRGLQQALRKERGR